MPAIKQKRSSTAGTVPTSAQAQEGELLLNTADGYAYTKHTDNQVIRIGTTANRVQTTTNIGSIPQSDVQTVLISLKAQLDAGLSGGALMQSYRYVSTAGQTTFTGVDADGKNLTYVPGLVLVFRSGVFVPFTGTTGTSIVLGTPASAGDEVLIIAFSAFAVADVVRKSGDTMQGTLNIITPAQFDVSQKVVNSEFVQRSLGNFRGVSGATVSRALTADDAGKYVSVSPGVTVTLPLAASMPGGTALRIRASSSGVGNRTIVASGSETIALGNAESSSITIGDGESLTLIPFGNNQWVQVDGSTGLGNTAAFGSSLGINGYQKLPSGLILQWGKVVTDYTTQTATVSFPITFPNACLNVTGTPLGGGGAMFVVSAYNQSTLMCTVSTAIGTTGVGSFTAHWIAVGY